MKGIVILLLLIATPVYAAPHQYKEKVYQTQWCNAHYGKTEFVLFDRTRVDCLTDEYAVEFDFAPKWAEAIGQARYYALITGKLPAVVLILESDKDNRFIVRFKKASPFIKLWLMRPRDIK